MDNNPSYDVMMTFLPSWIDQGEGDDLEETRHAPIGSIQNTVGK